MRGVRAEDIAEAVRALGLQHRPVCLHASLRSFGGLEGGAQAVLRGFLDEGCTVMVPTFSGNPRPRRGGDPRGAGPDPLRQPRLRTVRGRGEGWPGHGFQEEDAPLMAAYPVNAPTHVVGDLHGHLEVLKRLLRDAGLLSDGGWRGGGARLLFMGDFFDRGPDGLGCLELVMRLQGEATAAGGWVEALVGNHDLLLLAAHHFGEEASTGPGGTFLGDWRANGGVNADLAGLTAAHVAWLSTRPAMLHLGDTLYLHGDTTLYETLGSSLEEVNHAFRTLMAQRDAAAWDALLEDFSEHEAFFGEGGAAKAQRLLTRFGGVRLVHAHTPIAKLTGQPDATVTAALVYADGLCTDIDHGLYRGGPGFVHRP